MENARQFASHAFGARSVPYIDSWVADVPAVALDVDEICSAYDFDPAASSQFIRPQPAPRRNFQAKPYPRCVIGFFACDFADRLDHHVPGVPDMADVRRDSARLWPPVCYPQELTGVGDRSPG